MSVYQLLSLLAECAVKSTVVIVAALLVVSLLRRQSAALRHAVWTAALAGSLVMPVLVYLLPSWSAEIPLTTELQTALYRGSAPIQDSLQPFHVSAVPRAASVRAPHVVLSVWLIGCVIWLAKLGVGYARLRDIAAQSLPAGAAWRVLLQQLGNASGARLLIAAKATMPITWGLTQARILLPSAAEEWPDERKLVVLLHELAHVRRRDWLAHIVAEICRTLYWFHPFVWFACNRLRLESEKACDDAVLRWGIRDTRYAEHLLEIARGLTGTSNVNRISLAMARSHLERRFTSMLKSSLRRDSLTRRASILTAVAAAAIIVPVSTWNLVGQGISGRLSGSVADASKGAIPSATVIASNAVTKTRDMTTTDGAGSFAFEALPPGEYTIEILKPGFEALVKHGVAVQAGKNTSDAYSLNLGKISETITVTAPGYPRRPETVAPSNRIRVGGNVQAAKLLNMVQPEYPPSVSGAGVEGTVLMEAVISTEGVPLSLRVMNAQVNPELAKAAVEAVRKWRYQPTLLNGEPMEIVTRVAVNFTLRP